MSVSWGYWGFVSHNLLALLPPLYPTVVFFPDQTAGGRERALGKGGGKGDDATDNNHEFSQPTRGLFAGHRYSKA
ncbi:hypothetical protein BDZ91DRAFT_740076 [Kalaharituber pfeilii]|nr:hypothetical protein BDZ91DRAFT_740076 [Kalaharituber pfeilii]